MYTSLSLSLVTLAGLLDMKPQSINFLKQWLRVLNERLTEVSDIRVKRCFWKSLISKYVISDKSNNSRTLQKCRNLLITSLSEFWEEDDLFKVSYFKYLLKEAVRRGGVLFKSNCFKDFKKNLSCSRLRNLCSSSTPNKTNFTLLLMLGTL